MGLLQPCQFRGIDSAHLGKDPCPPQRVEVGKKRRRADGRDICIERDAVPFEYGFDLQLIERARFQRQIVDPAILLNRPRNQIVRALGR
jgi:hypothetical protein